VRLGATTGDLVVRRNGVVFALEVDVVASSSQQEVMTRLHGMGWPAWESPVPRLGSIMVV